MKKIILLSLLFITACSSKQKALLAMPLTCDSSEAYAVGLDDQRSGKKMNTAKFSNCRKNKVGTIKAYKNGYLRYERPKKPKQLNNMAKNSPPNPRKYECVVKVFTDRYQSFGETQPKARRSVAGKCESQHHSMHCEEISCNTNL
jgi:hypothetical protein